MNSRLKIVTVALVMVAVAGVLVYTPLISAAQSGGDNRAQEPNCIGRREMIWWLLNKSEPTTIEGEAITYHKDMLVVNTADGQVRIALPEEWTVGTDLVMREMLFGSGFLRVGENVTVSALRADVIDKEELAIYLLIGYEIIDETGVRAYATIPLNIET